MRNHALTALAVMALIFGALVPAFASAQGSVSEPTEMVMDHGQMLDTAETDNMANSAMEKAHGAGHDKAQDVAQDAMDQAPMDQAPMDHDAMAHDAMDSSTAGSGDNMESAAPMEHDHEQIMKDAAELAAEDGKEVGIEEQLGSLLAEAEFTDSEGNAVVLRDLIDAPTILLPIYFKCPDVCNLLQSNFSQILPEVKLEPGKELKIISLSFDPRDTTKDAANAKRQYIAALQGGFPAEHWTFLTGDQKSIDAALDSIGYTVRKQGGLYAHPVAVVSVAPGGKIVRYLYGPGFLPMDVTIAATKAAQGVEALSVKRLLSMCYSYDPEGRRYVFSTLRVAGFSIMTFVIIFLAFLMLGGKKKTAPRRKKARK